MILSDTTFSILLTLYFFVSVVFDDNPCDRDPCVHGNCVDLVLDFRCDCFLGYKGRSCSGNFKMHLKETTFYAG